MYKEVKGSGAVVSALDLAFKESVTDVDDKSRLRIDRSIFSSFNPSNPNSDNKEQPCPEKDDSTFLSLFSAMSPARGRCGL